MILAASPDIGACINDILPTELIQDTISNLSHSHYLAALYDPPGAQPDS
jgi:hypothetical protein